MSGLYVKLDVEYMTNPKLLDAGPLAELLYVRSLCFAKRTMKDGFLSSSQVNLITFGVPAAKKHVRLLVDSGLWEAAENGGYRIAGWLDRNKSAAQIEVESERKKQASVLANHERWHQGSDGKSSPTCPLCYPAKGPTPHPKPDRSAESTEPKEETETEEEEETKPETEEETIVSSSSMESRADPQPWDDDDFETAIEILVDHRCAGRAVGNMRAYRPKVEDEAVRLDGEAIRALIAQGYTPQGAVDRLLEVEVIHGTQLRKPIPWCGPDCDLCEGSAFIEADGGLAPCPNRKEVT